MVHLLQSHSVASFFCFVFFFSMAAVLEFPQNRPQNCLLIDIWTTHKQKCTFHCSSHVYICRTFQRHEKNINLKWRAVHFWSLSDLCSGSNNARVHRDPLKTQDSAKAIEFLKKKHCCCIVKPSDACCTCANPLTNTSWSIQIFTFKNSDPAKYKLFDWRPFWAFTVI